MKCPCKDCADRKLLCHGSCEKYKAWKEESERVAKQIRLEKEGKTNKNLQPFWRSYERASRFR